MSLRPIIVRAAGGVVVRRTAVGVEIALVYRSSRSDWGFPKGKLEPGESEIFCARREVEEETGLICNVWDYLGHTEYVDRRDRPKIVHYWLMEPIEGEFKPSEEVDDMQWVPPGLAKLVLTYAHDRALLAKVIAPIVRDRGLARPA
ncbi:MAG: NUDIX hydrolase [Acidimicrobiales bacterium]